MLKTTEQMRHMVMQVISFSLFLFFHFHSNIKPFRFRPWLKSIFFLFLCKRYS